MTAVPSELISLPGGFKELAHLMKERPVSGWEDAWKAGITPWISGDIQPGLRGLVMSNELDLPKAGRALVPGCGRGYDAAFIASHLGLDALGIDLSPTAIQIGRDHLDRNASSVLRDKVSLEVVDFFSFAVSDDQRFTLIYDYTFFGAFPPIMRNDWGKKMSALMKPGGYLITLVWPLCLPEDHQGPPFCLKPEHYADVLGDGWETVLDKVPENGFPGHAGRERLVVYRKL